MNFVEINDNGTVEGFCLVKNLEEKKTAKGIPYLDLILTDSSGEIGAKLWDYKEEIFGFIKQNSLLKVRGSISMFNDAPQMRLDRVRLANENDGVRIEDYVPSAEYNGEAMYSAIVDVVNDFENAQLKTLVMAVLEQNKTAMLYWPAAFKLHHAIRGGLLYHTLSILRMAQSIAEIYPSVEKDLLFSGVILHDVAKIGEFEVSETGIASGYTVEGTLIGHLVKGAMNIEKIGEQADTGLRKLQKQCTEKEESRKILQILAVNSEYQENYENAGFYYEQMLLYDETYRAGYGEYGMFLFRTGQKEAGQALWTEYKSKETMLDDTVSRNLRLWEKEMTKSEEKS